MLCRIVWTLVCAVVLFAGGALAGETQNGERRRSMEYVLVLNGKEFAVDWNGSAAAEAFLRKLPLTLTMQDFNGNEKFGTLPFSLAVEKKVPTAIAGGEIMLFRDTVLVLFYEDIPHTPYSYTPLGRIAAQPGSGDWEAFVRCMREYSVQAEFKRIAAE